MNHQVIYLLASAFGGNAAVLPVGVVVRADNGQWDHLLLETPEAATWSQLLQNFDPAAPLEATVIEKWQEMGNGLTFDLRVEQVEGGEFKLVFDAALAQLISDFAIISEEL